MQDRYRLPARRVKRAGFFPADWWPRSRPSIPQTADLPQTGGSIRALPDSGASGYGPANQISSRRRTEAFCTAPRGRSMAPPGRRVPARTLRPRLPIEVGRCCLIRISDDLGARMHTDGNRDADRSRTTARSYLATPPTKPSTRRAFIGCSGRLLLRWGTRKSPFGGSSSRRPPYGRTRPQRFTDRCGRVCRSNKYAIEHSERQTWRRT